MWQKVVREKMKALGFRACVTVPCLCYHQDRDVFVVVHVDDFLCSGETGDLAWFRGELENSFELKSQVVGLGLPPPIWVVGSVETRMASILRVRTSTFKRC